MSTELVDAVGAYLAAFNAGDVDAMSAAFVPNGSILDGMAPHLWTGPTAVSDWYRDVMAESAHLGASDYHVTLGEPTHHDIKGASGYLVAPATMTFTLNGAAVTQSGSTFTVALHKLSDGWRIAAWAWSKGSPQP